MLFFIIALISLTALAIIIDIRDRKVCRKKDDNIAKCVDLKDLINRIESDNREVLELIKTLDIDQYYTFSDRLINYRNNEEVLSDAKNELKKTEKEIFIAEHYKPLFHALSEPFRKGMRK